MLTPLVVPPGTRVVTVTIPDGEEWQAPVLGALLALTEYWRWKQSEGGVSVADTAAIYLDAIWEALP